jgi:hypothetical protein
LRAYGGDWVSAFKLDYVLQYATEKPEGLNPAAFTLHESMAEGAATWDIYTLKLNYEALEGNGTVGFVTPIKPSIAMPLIEGLANEVVCGEHRIRELLPFRLTPYDEAVRNALEQEKGPA